ncbi:hypothetical protein [Aquimarina spongiae]|uniref:Uncharacterized protein n=1 Tax=Aquimarina spongiae TaxID=570521 RepID=A0A1M6CWV0_9FLAO|nr:hypothetical protein [Aquimarina spongiae]SHI65331.1 hypothetical protein SAMN04488508_102316 [Aquimarina spongiae]
MEENIVKKDVFMMALLKAFQKPVNMIKVSYQYLLYFIVFMQMMVILFGVVNLVYIAIYSWKNM